MAVKKALFEPWDEGPAPFIPDLNHQLLIYAKQFESYARM
jgi:hypothetical protein